MSVLTSSLLTLLTAAVFNQVSGAVLEQRLPLTDEKIAQKSQISPDISSSRKLPYPSSELELVELGGVKYLFVDERATWFDALSFCLAVGMDLATIHSSDEHLLIFAYIQSLGWYGNRLVWIGGHTLSLSTPDWKWITGAPMNYTEGWASTEPNDFLGSRCMAYFTGGWHDTRCHERETSSWRAAFICKERIV